MAAMFMVPLPLHLLPLHPHFLTYSLSLTLIPHWLVMGYVSSLQNMVKGAANRVAWII